MNNQTAVLEEEPSCDDKLNGSLLITHYNFVCLLILLHPPIPTQTNMSNFIKSLYYLLHLVLLDSNQSVSSWRYSKSLVLHLGYLSLVMQQDLQKLIMHICEPVILFNILV